MAERSSWSVKGIDNRARVAAREGAQARGLTIGEYINRLLLEFPDEGGEVEPAPQPRETLSQSSYGAFAKTGAPAPSASAMPADLDWLTQRIEAAENRSTLAITGIDKSLMGLMARIETAESGQVDVTNHVAGLIEDLQGMHEQLGVKIRRIESDDTSRNNLDSLKSLEDALGRMASQMFEKHEEIDQNFSGDGARLAAQEHLVGQMGDQLAALPRQIEEASAKTTNIFTEHLRNHTETVDFALDEAEARQRQSLAEAEQRSRKTFAEMEQRLRKDLPEHTASTELVEARMDQLAESIRKDLPDADDLIARSSAHVDETVSLLRQFTQSAIEEATGDLNKAMQDTQDTALTTLQDFEARADKQLAETSETANAAMVAIEAAEAKADAALSEARQISESVAGRVSYLETELARGIGIATDVESRVESGEATVQLSLHAMEQSLGGVQTSISTVEHSIGLNQQKINALEETSFEANAHLIEMQSRVATAETQTNEAFNQLDVRLSEMDARMEELRRDLPAQSEGMFARLESVFEAFSEDMRSRVEDNRKEFAADLAQINERALNTDHVAHIDEKLAQITQRMTASELRQAGALGKVGDQISEFRKSFDMRLEEAGQELDEAGMAATKKLRSDLVRFSKSIQSRISALENSATSDEQLTELSSRVEEVMSDLSDKIETTESRMARNMEHLSQQVGAAVTNARQMSEEGLQQLNARMDGQDAKLSDVLTGVSERLERLQSGDTNATGPIVKAVENLGRRMNALEDFDAPPGAPRRGGGGGGGRPPRPQQQAGGLPDWDDTSDFGGPQPSGQNVIPPQQNRNTGGTPRPPQTRPLGAAGNDFLADVRGNLSQQGESDRARERDMAAAAAVKPKRGKLIASPGIAGIPPKHLMIGGAVVGATALGVLFLMRPKTQPDTITTVSSDATRSSGRESFSISVRDNSAPVAGIDTDGGGDAMPDLNAEDEAWESLLEPANTAEDDASSMASTFANLQAAAARNDPQAASRSNVTQTASTPFERGRVDTTALTQIEPLTYTPPRSREQAAASGDASAQLVIGLERYEAGDFVGAIQMLQPAAGQGEPMAQYRVAQMYELGQGVQSDVTIAYEMIQASANGGNVSAMHDYASFLYEGILTTQDNANAARWFKRAAEMGFVDSQFNLSLMYTDGIGVEPNLTEALFWMLVAAANGDNDAPAMIEHLTGRVSEEAATQTQARAAAWRAEPSANVANGRLGREPWNATRGANVRHVQTALNALGFSSGTPDGAIGPNTRRAINAFEASQGLPETGRVTPALIEALNGQIRSANA